MNTANKLTFSRIILVPIFLIFILPLPEFLGKNIINFMSEYGTFIAVVIFLTAAITDILDGSIARKTNTVTNLGKFLDPVADKLLVISAFAAFVELGYISAWVLIIVFARAIMVTALRIIAADQGVVIAASSSGKIKTTIQIIAVIAMLLRDYLPFSIYDWLMGVAVIVTILSGLEYIYKNKNLFSTKEN